MTTYTVIAYKTIRTANDPTQALAAVIFGTEYTGGYTEREDVYYQQDYKTRQSALKLQKRMEADGCRVEVVAA